MLSSSWTDRVSRNEFIYVCVRCFRVCEECVSSVDVCLGNRRTPLHIFAARMLTTRVPNHLGLDHLKSRAYVWYIWYICVCLLCPPHVLCVTADLNRFIQTTFDRVRPPFFVCVRDCDLNANKYNETHTKRQRHYYECGHLSINQVCECLFRVCTTCMLVVLEQ